MNRQEAMGFITMFYTSDIHTEEDKFLFEEAQHFLINTYHDPNDMHNLAFYYAEERRFELYQKYLEMAAEYNYFPAYEGLGYMWLYGQTGQVDHRKAFEYFSKGAECHDDYIRIECEMKIADMYANGYFVTRDLDKYFEIIERLYDELSHPENIKTILPLSEFLPNPGITYRYAGIIACENPDTAMKLVKESQKELAENLRNNPFWWGNIMEMEIVLALSDEISPGINESFGIYNLLLFAQESCVVTFAYGNQKYLIECILEDEGRKIKE